MESRPRQAEELLAIAAHDLRNPLTCIEGYAQLLLSRELPPEERAKMLQRIVSCSRFAEQIVEDVLDASALDRGALPVRKSQVALPGVLRQALETMEPAAAVRGATLTLRCPQAPRAVLADAARIAQVVQNLVGNALKHLPAAGGRVEVSVDDRGLEIQIEVLDNGSGIEPAQLDRLFQKYYQAEGRCRSSLGLGLHIAKSIVEAHGGAIWARSEGLGLGACFAFTLPAYDPERAYLGYKAARGVATPPPRPVPRRASWRPASWPLG